MNINKNKGVWNQVNIWKVIAEKIEQETGYQVVPLYDKDDTINEVILLIGSVNYNSRKNVYEVKGDLAIKYSHEQGCWDMVTALLDLETIGCCSEASLSTYANGFMAMSIEFNVLVSCDQDGRFKVKGAQYD